MPIYVYTCQECDKSFEKLFIKNENYYEMECEDCGGVAIRVPSYSNFVIHGYAEKNNYNGEGKK